MSPIALVLSSSIFLKEQCTHKVPSTSPFSANPCISNSRVACKKKKTIPKIVISIQNLMLINNLV